MARADKILKDALALNPTEKAELIDKLLSSLDKPDVELEAVWAQEAESRIDAYERGAIKALCIGKGPRKVPFKSTALYASTAVGSVAGKWAS